MRVPGVASFTSHQPSENTFWFCLRLLFLELPSTKAMSDADIFCKTNFKLDNLDNSMFSAFVRIMEAGCTNFRRLRLIAIKFCKNI